MSPPTLMLDELTGLCDELHSLSKSGIPLPQGLASISPDLPPRLREATDQISKRLDAGESLAHVLASPEFRFPPVFQVLVGVGLRGGRVAAAFEAMAKTTRRANELRQVIFLSLLYPLLILVLVAFLSVGLLGRLSEMYLETAHFQGVPSDSWNLWFAGLTARMRMWLWLLPIALALLGLHWIWNTRKALTAQPSRLAGWMSWVPWGGQLLRFYRLSTFGDLMAMLLEQGVPLSDSLRLAADGSGDSQLQLEAKEAADRIDRGQPAFVSQQTKMIPSFLGWILSHESNADCLVTTLRDFAGHNQRRAEMLAYWMRIQLPIYLSLCIGGTTVAAYSFAVIAPWYSMLSEIDLFR